MVAGSLTVKEPVGAKGVWPVAGAKPPATGAKGVCPVGGTRPPKGEGAGCDTGLMSCEKSGGGALTGVKAFGSTAGVTAGAAASGWLSHGERGTAA